jgi:tetratricopeptide (TPR) repeat protein
VKIFRFHVGFSELIILTILVGGIGGIISGAYPWIGAAMTIIGVIGALIDRCSSEIRNKQIESLIDAQALLLANKGLGNLYTEAGKIELKKGGSKAVENFQKALDINPDDKEALASLSAILALELSNQNWLHHGAGKKYQTILSIAKSCALKGKQIAPKDHECLR